MGSRHTPSQLGRRVHSERVWRDLRLTEKHNRNNNFCSCAGSGGCSAVAAPAVGGGTGGCAFCEGADLLGCRHLGYASTVALRSEMIRARDDS